jgi:hypothetical protein
MTIIWSKGLTNSQPHDIIQSEINQKETKRMIKCPNCGSSAQIEIVWEDLYNYSTTTTKEYICGCGCHFEAIFEVKKTKILTEEN